MKINLILTLLICAMALYIVFGHNGILKYNEMTNIRESYELKIADMDSRINALQQELELAKKDRAYLENIIRRDLGLQKADEDLYIIRNAENSEQVKK